MDTNIGRRQFLQGTATAASGLVAGIGFEEQILLSHLGNAPDTVQESNPFAMPMPKGKIKDVEVSRVICGGNLIGGWAHSRDLMYVSRLFKEYNTDAKILETLHLCQEYVQHISPIPCPAHH